LIYCDTSFLGALYLPDEVFEPVARSISASLEQSIPFPWLTEIELCNAVYRGLGRKLYDKGTCAAILRQISADKAAGILSPRLLESEILLKGAIDLAKRFTAAHQCRTLDILHVVAALEFKADTMASFDNRQRQLAANAGLILLPERNPTSKSRTIAT
jgi:predicted nucleic acid-binding protein